MADLHLEAGEDHVERLAHENDPVRAVVELVWNSVDAEATEVEVAFEKNEMDAITKVTVADNGHGIEREELASTFGRIGGSWKRLAARTKNGKRGLHGKRGEGRLRAFPLGNRVEWVSHSIDVTGQLQRVEISGSTDRRHVFSTDSSSAADVPSGTTVTAWNDSQRSLAALESSQTLSVLRSHFAPVLLNDPELAINYNGVALDPADEISHTTDIPLPFVDEGGNEYHARLRIIEWKSGTHRAVYYGQDGEHFAYEESAKDIEPQYRYSAYVTWEGFDDEALSTVGLGDMATGPVGALWTSAREGIRVHFAARRRERRREQVVKWKKDNVYPYQGEPQSEPERAERAVFDVISVALSTQIPSKSGDARLSLALLRDALRSDPDRLTTIIHEVAALSSSDRETLTRLLSETTLPAIIKAANLVTSRNKFLTGLEHLLFDPVDAKNVGERDHLHRILERELWIFGEAYYVMNSERGLTEMLRTHLKLEGLPTKGVEPVTRWDGKTGRVDLHLAAKTQEFDRTRHLVVELKAPDIRLGRSELDQVEDYANTVLSNSALATDKAEWDFVLVGTDMDDVARRRVRNNDFEVGQFWGPEPEPGQPRVRAFVRRWRNILDENRRRLAFMTTNLEHDPTLEEGLGHIREHYGDLLPPEVRGNAEVGKLQTA
ncbi:ATP-binding protein [Mycobacterium sp.]|uniref:ATP-binding protein n=1 Tax=Mycobacterium sp. TaxID=1785 RepID=UPI003F99B727